MQTHQKEVFTNGSSESEKRGSGIDGGAFVSSLLEFPALPTVWLFGQYFTLPTQAKLPNERSSCQTVQ